MPIAAVGSLLLDNLVGAAEQRLGNCKSQHLGCLEIDDHLDFGSLLDRHFGRLLSIENAANVNAGMLIRIGKISSVANQAAAHGKRAKLEDRGHRVMQA